MKPHRIVLYARVSTKDKQDNANQLHQLRDYAAKHGWEIIHEYIDRARGKTGDRAQFKAMMGKRTLAELSRNGQVEIKEVDSLE